MSEASHRLLFDFESDLRSWYSAELQSLGLPADRDDTLDEVIMRLAMFRHREISKRPRRVVWSTELRSRAPSLPASYALALTEIERISATGGDLNPYQSRDLAKPKHQHRPDPQLLHWGITHLHLGTGPDARYPAMIASTPDLLFVLVRDAHLHLIDVVPHNSFADPALFDIVAKNWPEEVAHAKTQATGLVSHRTPEEVLELRRSGVNTATIDSNGNVYMMAGGGVATTGNPVALVQEYLLPVTGALRAWQKLCASDARKVIELLPTELLTSDNLQLVASISSDGRFVVSVKDNHGGLVELGRGSPPKRLETR